MSHRRSRRGSLSRCGAAMLQGSHPRAWTTVSSLSVPHGLWEDQTNVTTHSTSSVLLARHGQTASNLERRYAGLSSEPLTEAGRGEMRCLAAQLETQNLSCILTSEVARARESALILGEALGVSVVADRRLNEMDLGPWEGLTEDEVEDRYPDEYQMWLTRPDLVQLEGRETLQALSARVMEVVAYAAGFGRPVLLMSHVAPIRVAALQWLGLPLRHYKRVPVQNAECFVMGMERGELRRLGDGDAFRTELAQVVVAERAS